VLADPSPSQTTPVSAPNVSDGSLGAEDSAVARVVASACPLALALRWSLPRRVMANDLLRRHPQTIPLMGQLVLYRPDQTLDQVEAIRHLPGSRRSAVSTFRIHAVTIPADDRHTRMLF
jgi:hypothetical protein